jgi:hypothetical protein
MMEQENTFLLPHYVTEETLFVSNPRPHSRMRASVPEEPTQIARHTGFCISGGFRITVEV